MYDDGRVCISILHQPGDDPHGYETAAERWSPVHTVRVPPRDRGGGGGTPAGSGARGTPADACAAQAGAVRPCEASGLSRATCWLTPAPRPPAPPPQVESIILSIISMLSSPNDESPANVDAAKQWREDRDGFKKKVARIVRKSQEML